MTGKAMYVNNWFQMRWFGVCMLRFQTLNFPTLPHEERRKGPPPECNRKEDIAL